MLHIVETTKDIDTAVRDLEEAVQRHGFGVLHTYDLKAKMKEKGVEFSNECRILEVCNPQKAAQVLSASMEVSLGLPCRISVYEDAGMTRIGTVLPTGLMALFPGSDKLAPAADEVEMAILAMIEEAR